MKILMINKFLYPRGGSESYMLKLSEELSRQGHTVEFFGMFDEKNTVSNTANEYTTNMDFHGKTWDRFLYPFKILYSFEAKKKLGRVLDEFRPDVVHMNNINFQLTPSIIYAVKKRNIPLVQTVHDFQMICPNHLFYSFSENKPCERCLHGSKWNCLKYGCIHDSKVKSLLGVLEAMLYQWKKTYQLVDLYICPSRFLEQKLLSANKLYEGKTFTIHNFIEKHKKTAMSREQTPYIVFVGRLSKEKGVALLAETAKKLPEYHFVVAGSGPDGDVLAGLPNVTLKGFVSGEALTNLMANAYLLIAPSVCYENCPLSILEAHALGVPVVTMNYGGMAELVENGVNGTLADAATPESLVRAIEKNFDSAYYAAVKASCETMEDKIMTVKEYAQVITKKYQDLIKR